MTGSLVFENINFIGNGSTSRLMNLTASGFPGLTMEQCNINGWGAVSQLINFGGGIAIGRIQGSGNANGIFNVVNAVFFGVENCFFQNFSDTNSNFFTIDALTARVAMILTGVVCQPNENAFLINSSFTGEAIVTTEFGTPAGQLFDPAGLDGTSIYVDVNHASNQPDSITAAEAFLTGNTSTTTIPAQSAFVEINNNQNWFGNSQRMTIATDGVVTLNKLSTADLSYSGQVSLEPATASKSISVKIVSVDAVTNDVTFTNATNLVNETATSRVDGELVSFRSSTGTLPTGVGGDIVFFVINKLTNSFQLSYTSGGAAVTFSDDGSGDQKYQVAKQSGSTPTSTISASAPVDLIPQANVALDTDDETFLVVLNNDDSVNILVRSAYQRFIGVA